MTLSFWSLNCLTDIAVFPRAIVPPKYITREPGFRSERMYKSVLKGKGSTEWNCFHRMFSKIKIAHCEIQIRPLVIQNRPVKAAKFETDAAWATPRCQARRHPPIDHRNGMNK